MKTLLKLIDSVPIFIFAIIGVVMGLAPFPIGPRPHLVEKLVMLFEGHLVSPLDIFDLFWHGLFPILFLLKLLRIYQLKKQN